MGIEYYFAMICWLRARAPLREWELALQLFRNFLCFGYSLDFITKDKGRLQKNRLVQSLSTVKLTMVICMTCAAYEHLHSPMLRVTE